MKNTLCGFRPHHESLYISGCFARGNGTWKQIASACQKHSPVSGCTTPYKVEEVFE